MELTIDAEFIDNCYKTVRSLIEKHEVVSFNIFLEIVEERYIVCPASTQDNFYSAFPGGLMYHSLTVFGKLKRLNKMLDKKYDNNLLCSLAFWHCVGKVGSKEEPYYIEKKSPWHNEHGIWYDYNKDLEPYMTVPHRSLWWTRECDTLLTEEEFVAIMLSEGVDTDNSKYRFNKAVLSTLLNTAIEFAIQEEKQNKIVRSF